MKCEANRFKHWDHQKASRDVKNVLVASVSFLRRGDKWSHKNYRALISSTQLEKNKMSEGGKDGEMTLRASGGEGISEGEARRRRIPH
jgi:hypothetical protein